MTSSTLSAALNHEEINANSTTIHNTTAGHSNGGSVNGMHNMDIGLRMPPTEMELPLRNSGVDMRLPSMQLPRDSISIASSAVPSMVDIVSRQKNPDHLQTNLRLKAFDHFTAANANIPNFQH